jgi:hypothetical protein
MTDFEKEERMTKAELYAITFCVVAVLAMIVVCLDVYYWRV